MMGLGSVLLLGFLLQGQLCVAQAQEVEVQQAAVPEPNWHLLYERAQVALEEQRPNQARKLALSIIKQQPEFWQAHWVYLEASAAVGLGEQVDAEYATVATESKEAGVIWRWFQVESGQAPDVLLDAPTEAEALQRLAKASHAVQAKKFKEVLELVKGLDYPAAMALKLRAQRSLGRERDTLSTVRKIIEHHARKPDLLAGLWIREDGGRRIRRARREATRYLDTLTYTAEELVVLYRLRRLFLEIGDSDSTAVVVDRLVFQGEAEPLRRVVWSEDERKRVIEALLAQEKPVLPRGTAEEVAVIADELVKVLEKEGRIAEALLVWEQRRSVVDDAKAALAHVGLLLKAQEVQRALSELDAVMVSIVSPTRIDIQRLNTGSWTQEMVQALDYRAECLEELGRPEDALVTRTLVSLLSPTPEHFAQRGAIQEQLGLLDLAFVSYSISWYLGGEVGEALPRTYQGIGPFQGAAESAYQRWIQQHGGEAPRGPGSTDIQPPADEKGQEADSPGLNFDQAAVDWQTG